MTESMQQPRSSEFIDYKLQQNLNEGVFANIDFFSGVGASGWALSFSDPSLQIQLQAKLNGIVIGTGRTATERPDVAALAKVEGHFGFQITWHFGKLAAAIKTYKDEEQPPIQIFTHLDTRPILSPKLPTAGEIRKWLRCEGFFALGLEPFSAAWLRAVSELPPARDTGASPKIKGFLEASMYSELTAQTIVVGWVVGPPEAVVWLEDNKGTIYPLDNSHQFFRQDVFDSIAKVMGGHVTAHGFIAIIETSSNPELFKLRSLTESGVHTLGENTPGALPSDPASAARWLFAISSPLSEFSQRAQSIDIHVLDALIGAHNDAITDLPVKLNNLGTKTENPRVSMIIPLYGRTDFVEHQLIEFSRDPWLLKHAELIYVLDDPTLVENFNLQAHNLHRLYKIPFQWVWGSANRGFSGANNLGAQIAKGEFLLFMNSDVFPEAPDWLQPLVDTLNNDATVGAVGPRLVFADGGIQHAGMTFVRREEIGAWINHHPNMGLDPAYDPYRETTQVPAITGACILIRRQDFDLVEGWDTGYLIGDFEDSDLCLKLRSIGFGIAYNPRVQLTHLERQSFKLLGQDEFRSRVTLYNAARHQAKWSPLIESSAVLFQ